MKFVLALSSLLVVSTTTAFTPPLHQQQYHTSTTTSTTALDASKCGNYDFDVAIIGCGVGGHGAALHARAQNLETAVFAGNDVGGTCVNRGCVPSKALLAASGRVREMKNENHLSSMGITVQGEVTYDRQGIADHANNLAARVKGNLEASLTGLGVEVVQGRGILTGTAHEIKDENTGKVYTAKVRECVLCCVVFVSFVYRTLFLTYHQSITFDLQRHRTSSSHLVVFHLSRPALPWMKRLSLHLMGLCNCPLSQNGSPLWDLATLD